jgi:hypothetical protein
LWHPNFPKRLALSLRDRHLKNLDIRLSASPFD